MAALAQGGIAATGGLGMRVWVLLLTLTGGFLAAGRLPRLHAT